MGVASGCGEQEVGVASGCGEQEVGVASGSGWNLWVWLLGVVVRRYIDFLIQQHPYFLFIFKKCFSFLFQYFFKLHFRPVAGKCLPLAAPPANTFPHSGRFSLGSGFSVLL